MTHSRWVVVGATGFVGRELVKHLEANGIGVQRVPAPRLRADLLSGARGIAAVAEQSAWALLAGRFDSPVVVVNAAGLATPDAQASAELTGANALLPAVIGRAAAASGARRFVHLSSASVQGDAAVIDDSPKTMPFSPYSESKALGEHVLLSSAFDTEVVIVRATSVQGPGRHTTRRLQRIAGSPLATVASPGTQPTTVSSIYGLVEFVCRVGQSSVPVPRIVLQPWEGATTRGCSRDRRGAVAVATPTVAVPIGGRHRKGCG